MRRAPNKNFLRLNAILTLRNVFELVCLSDCDQRGGYLQGGNPFTILPIEYEAIVNNLYCRRAKKHALLPVHIGSCANEFFDNTVIPGAHW